MLYFYEIVKIIYFIATVFVGVFFLKGNLLFPAYYETMILYIMPGYLVLCGIMMGYIASQMTISFHEDDINNSKLLLQRFGVGSVLGLVLAILYISL